MKKRIKIIIILIIIAAFCYHIFIPKNKEFSVYIPDALGTVSEIRIYSKDDSALSECREYIYKTDKLFSLTNKDSELSQLNSGRKIPISPETKDLLEITLSHTDNLTFNPFCGALIEVWDKAKAKQSLPLGEEISNANSFSYPATLKISDNFAVLENPGQKINLGAIAKGYITDGIVKILNKKNIDSALVYLGGNVYAKGLAPDNSKWKIGIANPDNSEEFIGILSVTDTSVITSGDYERYFEIDGTRYHHIIDPKTGYPADSGLRSVTIISPNATIGDMLSTKCFIAGFEASKEILSLSGVHAIFVTTDNSVYYSRELQDIFDYNNDNFTYHAF